MHYDKKTITLGYNKIWTQFYNTPYNETFKFDIYIKYFRVNLVKQ